MGAFNAWLKVVIPLIVFVPDEFPNAIPPVDAVYSVIGSVVALPINEFVVWVDDVKFPLEALYNNNVLVLRFDEPDEVDEKGM